MFFLLSGQKLASAFLENVQNEILPKKIVLLEFILEARCKNFLENV